MIVFIIGEPYSEMKIFWLCVNKLMYVKKFIYINFFIFIYKQLLFAQPYLRVCSDVLLLLCFVFTGYHFLSISNLISADSDQSLVKIGKRHIGYFTLNY